MNAASVSRNSGSPNLGLDNVLVACFPEGSPSRQLLKRASEYFPKRRQRLVRPPQSKEDGEAATVAALCGTGIVNDG
jgi:hypothetical protein